MRLKGPLPATWLWDRVLSEDERRRLGGDLGGAYARHGGAVGMWRELRGASVPQAVVAVGVAVGTLDAGTGQSLLRALGEIPGDAVESAVGSGGLVLAEAPRQAFWECQLVAIDWDRHTAMWELLWALARASKGGGFVDSFALRERGGGDRKFVTKRKHRLVHAPGFPPSLADSVVSAGRGSYRLDLPPARIRVFERGAGDSLREWAP